MAGSYLGEKFGDLLQGGGHFGKMPVRCTAKIALSLFEPRLRGTPSLEANGGRPGCGRHRRLLTAGGSQPPTQVHQHRRYGNLDDRVKR